MSKKLLSLLGKEADFGSIMSKYNPLGFKEKNGEISTFADYRAAYVEMLDRLFMLFPKGYVDVDLFVVETYGVRLSDSWQLLGNFVDVGLIKRYDDELPAALFLMRWDVKSEYFKMEQFATALHFLTGTTFNRSMFLEAVAIFRAKYNLFGGQEN